MYPIRYEILITCARSHTQTLAGAQVTHTTSLQRPARSMQLVLHYSCGLTNLTLGELYILPSVLENIVFNVSGRGSIFKRAHMVQAPCLYGRPFELWNWIIHPCWLDFPTVALPPCADAESASVFHVHLQPHNLDQTFKWITTTSLLCTWELGSLRTSAHAGLDDRGVECVTTIR